MKVGLRWPINYEKALEDFDKQCTNRIAEIEGCEDKWLLMKESFIEGWDCGTLFNVHLSKRAVGAAFLFGMSIGFCAAVFATGFIILIGSYLK
jgi:hypothetical protein